MKAASKAFSNPLPNQLAGLTGGTPIPDDLQTVAATFVALQEARHEADYDISRRFTRFEVDNLVDRVAQAFQLWQGIKTEPTAQMYLAALLLWRKWNR
jgi:hypothetical protein